MVSFAKMDDEEDELKYNFKGAEDINPMVYSDNSGINLSLLSQKPD